MFAHSLARFEGLLISTPLTVMMAYLILTDQQLCTREIVGRTGEQLTLLCLADEPVENAVWIKGGVTTTNNITFGHLSTSDSGVYECRGAVGQQTVHSSISLRVSCKFITCTQTRLLINVHCCIYSTG